MELTNKQNSFTETERLNRSLSPGYNVLSHNICHGHIAFKRMSEHFVEPGVQAVPYQRI